MENADLAPGTEVDRYVVEDVIGRGGMAVVYRVHHKKLGTAHALKVLLIPAPSIQERMLQEGRVQATLRHANVVNVTDVIEVNGSYGLVMEYVAGPALDRYLWQEQKLTLAVAEGIGRGIIAGIAAAHAQNMIHRDLKPANILLATSEHEAIVPKITDFGLAKVLRGTALEIASATRTGHTMGTPQYMAPEQIRNAKSVDERADIFSLGALLYEVVCGTAAFPGDDVYDVFTRITNGQYVHPRDHVPDLPRRIEDALIGALEPDFERRVQSAADLLAIWTGERPWIPPAVPESPDSPQQDQTGSTGPTRPKTGALAKPARARPDAEPAPAPVASASPRRGLPWLGLAATLLAGAGLTLLATVTIGGWRPASGDPPVPRPEPEPVAVAPPSPEPAPEPILEPVAEPVPGSPPEPAAVARPGPRPRPGPKPAPVQVPVPTSVPVQAMPGPVVPAPGADLPTVYIKYKNTKDPTAPYTRGAKLKDSSGKTWPPGKVPVGSYTVWAGFDTQGPAAVGRVSVGAGQILTVWCNEKKLLCEP